MSTSAVSDLIPIKSTTKTVQQCFQTCLYVVPEFQRPYSWDIDELEDYWTDVVLARGDFFFGSTVTWVSESRDLFNDSYSIIDGQQRLTTSAIVLSVVRDSFEALVERVEDVSAEEAAQSKSQSIVTQKYLVAVDDDGKNYPVILRTEPNFREVVQEPSSIPSGKTWNGSAVQIGVARRFFEDKVQSRLGTQRAAQQLETLKEIRNNVLKARLIQVELSSEEDGFLIFETLNARGADLRLSDLVKNLLIRGGASSALDRTTIADRWQRVVDRVQTSSKSANAVDQFMWQSWNSRRTAVTEAELYKEIGRLVTGSAQGHLNYLAELEFDSNVYQYLEDVDPVIDKTGLDARSALRLREVSDTLRALALFNVSVANSAVLAAVRKYEKTQLMTKGELIEACRAIENFHFQFTALTNSGSTGGTRGRYNRFAVDLEQATSRKAVQAIVAALKSKLAGSLPADSEAKAAFAALFYAPKVRLTAAQKPRSRKHFIAYVLLRYAQEFNALPSGQDLTAWTIEHIRPQAEASNHVQDAEFSIGNLVLLTDSANGELKDGDLNSKRVGLRRYVPYVDETLAGWLDESDKSEVNAEDIKKRALAMAAIAVDTVWAVGAA